MQSERYLAGIQQSLMSNCSYEDVTDLSCAGTDEDDRDCLSLPPPELADMPAAKSRLRVRRSQVVDDASGRDFIQAAQETWKGIESKAPVSSETSALQKEQISASTENALPTEDNAKTNAATSKVIIIMQSLLLKV